MKLFNVLSVSVISSLLALGCSSTVTDTSDGGTDGAVDTGTGTGDTGTKTDTGTSGDTTPPSDTGSETSGAGCPTCLSANCGTQFDTCNADTQCAAGVKCINDCPNGTGRKDCINVCVTKAESGGQTKIDDLVSCLQTSCKTPCNF